MTKEKISDETAKTNSLYTVKIGAENVKVLHYRDVKHRLIPGPENNIKENNIFLGNGFNMSVDVETGYGQLGKALAEMDEVKLSCPTLRKKLGAKNPELEELLSLDKESELKKARSKSSENECVRFVRKEFFDLIIKRSRLSPKRKTIIMEFLADFKNIFTTNYDPVLYRLAISIYDLNEKIERLREALPLFTDNLTSQDKPSAAEEAEALRSLLTRIDQLRRRSVELKKKSEEIHKLPESLRIELIHHMLALPKPDRVTKSLVKDLLGELPPVSTNLKAASTKTAIEKFIGKPHLKKGDGFGGKRGQRPRWNGSCQNLFYLHGAFHMYKDTENSYVDKRAKKPEEALREEIYKITKNPKGSLLKALLERTHRHISVFQNREKAAEKAWNGYLKHCYERLEKIQGPLCIIGWRCAENDHYLAEAIKNSGAKPIFVAVLQTPEKQRRISENNHQHERTKPAKEIIQSYYASPIPNENLEFFDIEDIDYKSSIRASSARKKRSKG